MTEPEWRARVDNRLAAIEVRQNNAEKQNAVAEVHHANVEKRLTGIESSIQWVLRLIIGALIAALMAFMLGGGFNV